MIKVLKSFGWDLLGLYWSVLMIEGEWYYIVWKDIVGSQRWTDIEEIKNYTPWTVESMGKVIRFEEDYVSIAAHNVQDDPIADGILCIPTDAIEEAVLIEWEVV